MMAEAAENLAGAGTPEEKQTPSAPISKHDSRELVHGTLALGAGLTIERGFSFTANLLAARFGGASTFALLSFWRFKKRDLTEIVAAAGALVCGGALFLIDRIGRRHGWTPSSSAFLRLLRNRELFGPKAVATSTSGGFDA